MRQTSARQLLDGWDSVRGEATPLRAAALAALSRAVPVDTARQWSIARRDVALFDLRAQVFGEQLDGVAHCPACDETLEMRVALSQLRPDEAHLDRGESFEIAIDDVTIACRLPTTDDLLAIASEPGVEAARHQLLLRCIGTDDDVLRERAAALMPDQGADVRLNLTCPACQHQWLTPFDIAAFVWSELDQWATRTLHEIHTIASAYGWAESEILNLSARRRATYLEMIR